MAVINFGKESIRAEGTIESAVLAAGKNPDSFLFLVDGRPIPMDSILHDDVIVEAIRVASGG
ncbi:MAG: hypothetical protein WC067_04695 [Candidatus Methanomethylophilaceae archaeon]